MRVQAYPIEISFVHKDSLRAYLEKKNIMLRYLRNRGQTKKEKKEKKQERQKR